MNRGRSILAAAAAFLAGAVAFNASAQLTFYTDRTAFDAANPGLPVEDFEEAAVAAGGVNGETGPLSSATDNSSFDPGDILPGVSLDGVGGGATMFVGGANFFGAGESKTVGVDFFSDVLEIVFGPGVSALGFDFFGAFGGDAVSGTWDIDVFGSGGLLGSTQVSTSDQDLIGFFGVDSAGDLITSIRMDATGGSAGPGEAIDNLAFGSPRNGGEPIPAPAALPAGLALLGLVAARRRRRAA